MNIINFDEYENGTKSYGGHAGLKASVVKNGEYYLLKYGQNLKQKNFNNVELSYSNSPISEYISSQIYKLYGIDVHETTLGMRKNKIVVSCKDFTKEGEELKEFKEIKNMYEPLLDDMEHNTSGEGTNLNQILEIIENHNSIKDIKEQVINRFWQMFIVDFIIGNPDRNNENWGFIYKNNKYSLAPVYDNGNSLCSKITDKQIEEMTEEKYDNYLKNVLSCYLNDKNDRINPYHYIKNSNNELLVKNLQNLLQIDIKEKIKNIINDIPLISDVRKNFYCKLINDRIGLLNDAWQNKLTINNKPIKSYNSLTLEEKMNIAKKQNERIVNNEIKDANNNSLKP